MQGMSDIYEADHVQSDCTLSNIVLDADENAKIVVINRRGCLINWESPEFRGIIQNGQRISMFIGVKSDLYQMRMVIWAIAHQIEEPDRADRLNNVSRFALIFLWTVPFFSLLIQSSRASDSSRQCPAFAMNSSRPRNVSSWAP